MTKTETLNAALRASAFYSDCFKAFAHLESAEKTLMQTIVFAIESGEKNAYKTAFLAAMDIYSVEYAAPRQKVLDMMKHAGIKAPGKNGKRGKKTVEPVPVTAEAWAACFTSTDKKMALKIMAQLGW